MLGRWGISDGLDDLLKLCVMDAIERIMLHHIVIVIVTIYASESLGYVNVLHPTLRNCGLVP